MNAESLQEVLNILAEEGSDWMTGFFTFLFEEHGEAAASEEGGGVTSDPREEGGVASDPREEGEVTSDPREVQEAEPQPGSGSSVDQ